MDDFLERYVLFAGCANDNRYANYSWVTQLVVPGSNLQQRMLEALDGMFYAQSKGDEVDTITIHHYVRLEEGRYLVDVTWLVNTIGNEGKVQTTNNGHIIVVEQNGKLLVEKLMAY